jgi:hypothetical protein
VCHLISNAVYYIVHVIEKLSAVCIYTRWFKYDRDYLCVNKPQSVPVIFEPPCTMEEARRLRHVNRNKPVVKLRNSELFNADWG